MASLAGYYSQDDKPAEFDTLPAGDYVAAIVDSEMKPTQAGTGEYLKLKWQILEGQYANRVLFENLNLQNPNAKAVEIARGQLAAIRKATGVMSPNESSELHNIPVLLKVGCKKRTDGSEQIDNVIKSVHPKGGASNVASAPAASGANTVPPYLRKA